MQGSVPVPEPMVHEWSRSSPSQGWVLGLVINVFVFIVLLFDGSLSRKTVFCVVPLHAVGVFFGPVVSGSIQRRRAVRVVVFKGTRGKWVGLRVVLKKVHSSHQRPDLFFPVPSAAQKYREEKDHYLNPNQSKCPGNGASVTEESEAGPECVSVLVAADPVIVVRTPFRLAELETDLKNRRARMNGGCIVLSIDGDMKNEGWMEKGVRL